MKEELPADWYDWTSGDDEPLKYLIIGSGSSGNSVKIDNVLVDCGLPYNRIRPHLKGVKTLAITHHHGDHLNKSTLKRIRRLYPKIDVVANYDVAQLVPEMVDQIANPNFELKTRSGIILPFKCHHDVPCVGYTFNRQDQDIIYATDTYSLEDAPDKKYDYLFLESNYDSRNVEAVQKTNQKYGYNPLIGMSRHMATQATKAFYYVHRTKRGKLIELHKSTRFY